MLFTFDRPAHAAETHKVLQGNRRWGIIGIIVMTAGVGLFGTLSGFLATSFLSPAKPQAEEQPAADADTPKAKLAHLIRMLAVQEQSVADLKAQMEELDKLL